MMMTTPFQTWMTKSSKGNQVYEAMLQDLRRHGIARIPTRLTEQQLSILHSFLSPTPVWNAHVWAKATEQPTSLALALYEKRWPVMAHHHSTAVHMPFLFGMALSMYDLARDYFDEDPLLYSMNAFWTQPGESLYHDTHHWHRDTDDRKQLALFMYGTPIASVEDGAHMYQCGTHHGELFPAEVAAITNTSFFIADPKGLHMGARPNKPRLLAWARYGVTHTPASYVEDQLSPVELLPYQRQMVDTPKLQRAIQLIGH